MKKGTFLIFSVLFLFGCSAKQQDSKTTLTYLTMESLPEQRWALKQLVKKFEEKNPDIRVKVEYSSAGFQKLKIRIAGGEAPDVFYYTTDRMPSLVYRNALLDMTPFVENDPDVDLKNYFPETVRSSQIDGKLYLFPFHFSTDLLFYNRDLFDAVEVPYPTVDWSWDDFLQTAKKLTRVENKRVVQYGTLQPRTLLMVRSFGGECFDSGLNKVLIESPQTKKALSYLVDLESKHNVAPSPGQIKDIEKEDGLDLFSTGKVAMFVGRTYMVSELSKISRFSWDVAPVPKGKKRYSRLAVGGNCISKTTKNPEAAWKFVKFYSGYEGSRIGGLSRNCVPALEKIARSPLFLYAPPSNADVLIDSVQFSQIENYGLLNWDEFFQKSFKIETDKVLFHSGTIESCLSEISRQARIALAEDRKKRNE